MNNKLKPCPFCGNEKGLELSAVSIHGPPDRSIICYKCGANGPTALTDIDAQNTWNKRAILKNKLRLLQNGILNPEL